MMEITIWDSLTIITKILIYIGGAAAIGGPFIYALIDQSVNKKSIINYIAISSVLGFISVIINFFIQVGAFSETGLRGMLDTDMIRFLWESAVGDSVLWRLLGFTILAVALFSGRYALTHQGLSVKRVVFMFFYVVTSFCFAYSFTFIGHSADIAGIAKWLVGFHIVAVGWWIGALYPLWLCCKLLQPPALYKLMSLFGQIAMFVVGVLIVCGISLLLLFFSEPLEIFSTLYGQTMLLKLVFVVSILLIAAYHKYHLVEEVRNKGITHKLQSSIKNEMLIATIILVITAVLSSVLGPASLA